jgi:hypothetical protein
MVCPDDHLSQSANLRLASCLAVRKASTRLLSVHGRSAQQIGVNGCHAVGAVRADDREIGHSDLASSAFFDQAHFLDAPVVGMEAVPDIREQAAVDFADDFQVTRNHDLKPRQRPFLQRLGQQGVVRVRQRLGRDVPGLVPPELGLVQQNAH